MPHFPLCETGFHTKVHTSGQAPRANTPQADADGGLMAPTIKHTHTPGTVKPMGFMELLRPPTLTDGTAVREPINISCALPTKN